MLSMTVACSQCLQHIDRQRLEDRLCLYHADPQHFSLHTAHQPPAVHVGAHNQDSPQPLVHQAAVSAACV